MLNACVLVLMLQPAAASAQQTPEWSARVSAGVFGGYLLTAFGDDSNDGFGGGAEVSVPLWKHTNIDARAMRWFPSPGYGLYDLRLRQTIGAARGGVRMYGAAGIAGTIDENANGLDMNGPELFSLAFGAELRAGPHVIIPLEVSGMGSVRNAAAFMVSAGVKWAR